MMMLNDAVSIERLPAIKSRSHFLTVSLCGILRGVPEFSKTGKKGQWDAFNSRFASAAHRPKNLLVVRKIQRSQVRSRYKKICIRLEKKAPRPTATMSFYEPGFDEEEDEEYLPESSRGNRSLGASMGEMREPEEEEGETETDSEEEEDEQEEEEEEMEPMSFASAAAPPLASRKISKADVESFAEGKPECAVCIFANWCHFCQQMKERLRGTPHYDGRNLLSNDDVWFIEDREADESLRPAGFPEVLMYNDGEEQGDRYTVDDLYEFLGV
jgi:hypothetical protein